MIYLDNAATTKPLQSALDYAQRFLTDEWYNPSAPYGIKVRQEIEAARREIVATIADPDKYDLVFTSGGTEADNLAWFFQGHANLGERMRRVTTSAEHSAVAKKTAYQCKVDKYGFADVEDLLKGVYWDTALVSVIHVSNETGAINDINAIARKVKEVNPDCLFHSDGVQAFGKFPYKLSDDIDLYSISAHKIGGVKGTGALIYKKSIANRITPLLYGGGQEHGLRSGTENVFGIMAFRKAVEKTYNSLLPNCAVAKIFGEGLWGMLDHKLFKRISPLCNWSPYILSVSFTKGDGQALQALCHERGLIIGTGAACSTGKENRVLKACGLDSKTIRGAIRLSVSQYQSEQEIREAARILNECAKELAGV